MKNKVKLIEGFKYICIQEGVCGSEPTIIGTRLEPKQIVVYGTKEEAMEDFDLTKEQVDECYIYVNK